MREEEELCNRRIGAHRTWYLVDGSREVMLAARGARLSTNTNSAPGLRRGGDARDQGHSLQAVRPRRSPRRKVSTFMMASSRGTAAEAPAGSSDKEDPHYVWYACFGSNILYERFNCYLEGGRIEGMVADMVSCTGISTIPSPFKYEVKKANSSTSRPERFLARRATTPNVNTHF